MKAFWFSFVLLMVFHTGYGEQHQVVLGANNSQQINIKNFIYHFEDISDNLTIASRSQFEWEKQLGITTFASNLHVHWFKFSVTNEASQYQSKVLFIPYNHIHKIDAWVVKRDKDPVRLASTGTKRTWSQKHNSGQGYGINFTISPGDSIDIYIRMDHKFLPLRATSFLLTPTRFKEIETRSDRLIWLWRGFFCFACLLALTLFLFVKRTVFLHYFLLNLGFGLFMVAHLGDVPAVFGSDQTDVTIVVDYCGAFLINFFLPRFINNLVPIKERNPFIWKTLYVFVFVIFLVTISNLIPAIRTSGFSYWSHHLVMAISGLTFIVQPILLLKCIRSKDDNAIPFFLIYTFLVISGLANTVLPNLGLVEDSPFVYNSLIIGSFVEMFTFTFLMGRSSLRVYQEREELLVKQKTHQQEMLVSMVNSQEEERNKVGRELHDLIGANMAIIKQKLTVKEGALFEVVSDTIEKVRRMSHGLVSPKVKRDEFLQEIQEMCFLFTSDQMKINFIAHDWPNISNEKVTNHLYRICQELLHNASKHSEASEVFLQLLGEGENLTILYEDNGIGFDAGFKQVKAIGLNNIRYRLELIHATFELDSTPGRGTGVVISIPL